MTPAEKLAEQKKREPKDASPNRVLPVFACALRVKRQSLRLSAQDVADAMQISVVTLYGYEQGRDMPLHRGIKLAEFFGCPVSELWQPITDKEEGAGE